MRKTLGPDMPLCHPDIVPILLFLHEQGSPVIMSGLRAVISNYDTVKKRVEYLVEKGLVETKQVKSKNTSVIVFLTTKGQSVARYLDAAERTIAGELVEIPGEKMPTDHGTSAEQGNKIRN